MITQFSVKKTIFEIIGNYDEFTAIDVHNYMKIQSHVIKYREVADMLRNMFDLGDMDKFGYSRKLVTVVIDKDTTVTIYNYFRNSRPIPINSENLQDYCFQII